MGCFSCLFKVESNDIKPIKGDLRTYGQYSLSELRTATGDFAEANVLGIGGYAKVYKGTLRSGHNVAIKRLFLNEGSKQGRREYANEKEILSILRHPNVVKLIGHCAERDEKLLVYELAAMGSLADHLFDDHRKTLLDWKTRINIAVGVAHGLQYLHCTDPPIIHRDIKSSNILLDQQFKAKIGDFGLAKYGPRGNATHVSTRVMGSHGYCAPDYLASGKLNFKSDIYCFGVVLLELITGRIALDMDKPKNEQLLVKWASSFLKEKKKQLQLIDPSLKTKGDFPLRDASRFILVAERCLHHDPYCRPDIGDVVVALNYLASRSMQQPSRK